MFKVAYYLYIPLLFYQVLETASADTELVSDEAPSEFIQDEELWVFTLCYLLLLVFLVLVYMETVIYSRQSKSIAHVVEVFLT